MLILMISIVTLLIIAGICFLSRTGKKSDTYTKKITEDMHINFFETDSMEPVPVLSNEIRYRLHSRSIDSLSSTLSQNLTCPDPSRNTGNGNGKSSV